MFKASLAVLMAEDTGITKFKYVTPYVLLDGYESFVGKCCPLLQCASWRRRRPLSTPHATAFSGASFICKPSLPPFSGTPSVISSSFTAELYSWHYTVAPGVSVFDLPPELADCTIYVTFVFEDRGSMLHRSADMFVLWPNIPCQACLESCTELYLKESSINMCVVDGSSDRRPQRRLYLEDGL
jgi:hypothetical protein